LYKNGDIVNDFTHSYSKFIISTTIVSHNAYSHTHGLLDTTVTHQVTKLLVTKPFNASSSGDTKAVWKFVGWQQCAAVMQRETVIVMPSC